MLEEFFVVHPLLFDDISIDFWKISMCTFIQSTNYYIWNMIENDYAPPFKSINNTKVDTLFSAWMLEDKEFANKMLNI